MKRTLSTAVLCAWSGFVADSFAFGPTPPPPPPPAPTLIEGVCLDTHQKEGEGRDYPMADIVIKWSREFPLQFGEFEMPILARKPNSRDFDQYGTLRTQMDPLRNNATTMILEIDLPKVTQQNASNGGNFLPNGTKIPLGANNESVFKLALNNPNKPPVDWIYFSLSRGGNFVIGTTFQVKAFDKLYEKIPIPLTLFPTLIHTDEQGNKTPVVAAGIYGGSKAGTSGAGAFVDASPVLKPLSAEVCYTRR